MKRFFVLAVALVLIASTLAACGGSAKEVVLKDVLQTVNSKYDLSGLKELANEGDLNRYYSIDESGVKQFAAELTTAASQYSEVILIEAKDADAAKAVSTALSNHLDSQVNTAKSYDQDAVAMIESCSVKQSGNYVYLVIGENAADIVKTIEEEIK